MKDQPLPEDEQARHPIYSVVLIVLESLLTFLLHHDRYVRQLARGLIAREAVIEIRTYLPAETLYATFTDKGVLLDFKLPAGRSMDGRVTASFSDLVRGFVSAPPAILAKLQLEGDTEVIGELRQLMESFNLQHLLNSWWRYGVFGKSADKDNKTNQRVKPLLKKIDEQKKQLDTLTLQQHEQAYVLRQLQYRYNRLKWSALVVITVLMIALLGSMFW